MLRDAAALIAALALLRYFSRGQLFGYGRMRPPATRTRYLLRLVLRPLAVFGGGSVVLLALCGDLDAIGRVPAPLAPARAAATGWAGDGLVLGDVAWAMAAGALIGALVARLFSRHGWRDLFGDVSAVLPRRVAELPWSVAMAVSAGVSEELFFRLAVPFYAARLAAAIGGDPTTGAWAGITLGIVLFGLAHRYQGWRGIVTTGAVGALLAGGYLVADSLWTVVALHILIDLNALVLRPVLAGRVRW